MHRYCRNTTNDEECKRQEITTPSAREAWKRRRKKTEKSSQAPDIRPFPSPRTSGSHPGNPAPPNPRATNATTPARTSGLPSPDIRRRLKARTSGLPFLCTVKGRGPCIPSPPRLYILHLAQLSRVSKGLAHICVRDLLIHLDTFSTEIRASTGEDPPSGFKTPL